MYTDNWSITIDPTEIKLWAEAHRGKPEILDYEDAGSDEYILRFDFPGKKDNIFLAQTPKERKISWDKFFEIFTKKGLALEYEKDYEGNSPDMAYKFIKRNKFNEKNYILH